MKPTLKPGDVVLGDNDRAYYLIISYNSTTLKVYEEYKAYSITYFRSVNITVIGSELNKLSNELFIYKCHDNKNKGRRTIT